jgi:hypothetical protein
MVSHKKLVKPQKNWSTQNLAQPQIIGQYKNWSTQKTINWLTQTKLTQNNS